MSDNGDDDVDFLAAHDVYVSALSARILGDDDDENEVDYLRLDDDSSSTTDNTHTHTPHLVHCNNAGASPSPRCVLDTVLRHSLLESCLGGYLAADRAALPEVYAAVADLVHAADPSEIALVESATVAWTRIFYSLCEEVLPLPHPVSSSPSSGKVLLCCEAEYAANVVAMQKICTERGARLLVIPNCQEEKRRGVVDVDALDTMMRGAWRLDDGNFLDPRNVAMVCITHVPTNGGIVNPVNDIGACIDHYNANHHDQQHTIYYLVDACQSIGQLHVDVRTMRCHALTATGRKYLRGPRGTGFLYVRRDVADRSIPTHVDHAAAQVEAMVCDNNKDDTTVHYTYRPGASRFEFWEKNVANQLGLGRAVRYAQEQDLHHIEATCRALGNALKTELRGLGDGTSIYVHHEHLDPALQCGIVTFAVPGTDAGAIKADMLRKGFTLSVAPPTATPFDSAVSNLGEDGRGIELVRASLTYINSVEDVRNFCVALGEVLKEHGKNNGQPPPPPHSS